MSVVAPTFGTQPTPCNSRIDIVPLPGLISLSATSLWVRVPWAAITLLYALIGYKQAESVAKNAFDNGKPADSKLKTARSLGKNLFFFANSTYMYIATVVCLESTLAGNDVVPGDDVWSYGQLIPISIAVGGCVRMLRFTWRNATKSWKSRPPPPRSLVRMYCNDIEPGEL